MKINNTSVSSGIHAARVPSSGGAIYPFVRTYSANATQVLNANVLRCFPFYPINTFTITGFTINVQVSASTAVLRVLFFDDLGGRPYNKLYESTNIDATSTGNKLISQSYTFVGGVPYWISIHSSATPSILSTSFLACYGFQFNSLPGNVSNCFIFTYAIGSVPSTLPIGTSSTFNTFLISLNL